MSKKENALIKLTNAGVRKNRNWLVRGITMSVHSGEIVTLIGPNGSGKTTTAKMALGLLGLNEGTTSRKNNLRIGYVPQKLQIDWTVPIKVNRFISLTKKISDNGNKNILVTERGASFGYNTLVSDMRALPIMAKNGYPVIFDATHSVQQPGGLGEKSGGQREFVEHLARAAVAVGVAGVFIETHQDPDNAPSDGPNMIPLDKLENLLKQLTDIDNLIKN